MRQVLDDILQAEKDAEELLRNARQKASQLTRDADNELNQNRQQLKDSIRRMIQERTEKEAYLPETLSTEGIDIKELCGVRAEDYSLVKSRIVEVICHTFADGDL